MAAPARSAAVGLNGFLFVAWLPPLVAGLLDAFAAPAGSPLGNWLYPTIGAFAAGCGVNAAGSVTLRRGGRIRSLP